MFKFLRNFTALTVIALSGFVATSCDDDDKVPQGTPPEFSVKVNKVQRTEVQFTVESTQAQDYAYVVLPAGDAEPTAEEIFKQGTVGMLGEEGTADLTGLDVEGGNEYVLYVAVRKINPYVYSKVFSQTISTNIPYTELLTMERIGLTDLTYHIEMPAGVDKVKHIVVKKADYEAIKSILALYGEVHPSTYLTVFGHEVEATTNHTVDKGWVTAYDDRITIHSGTPYLVIAGPVDENGNCSSETTQVLEVSTRKADVCPNKVEISVASQSTSAVLTIAPDPEIVKYRLLVDKRTEFDYIATEGEEQVRNNIIGYWDDEGNSVQREYTGAQELKVGGLIPNTDYVVGVIGFDAQNREYYKLIDFTTSEPTGPTPTVSLTQVEPSVQAPWENAAVNVKLQNTVSMRGGFFSRADVEKVLDRGVDMATLIANNGQYFTDAEIAEALSPQGLTVEVGGLTAETDYIFGVYAVNDEYVATAATLSFTTDKLPKFGGSVRENMPGRYTATTTIDEVGTTASWDVTISTGYNDATRAEYDAKNWLVCVGFGNLPQFAVQLPADLLAAGATEEEAYANYGPKWFIEFTETDMYVAMQRTGSGSVLSDRFGWKMGDWNGTSTYLFGFGKNANTGRDMNNDNFKFPVSVSADGNTITISPAYSARNYWMTMVTVPGSVYSPTVQFRTYSNIVLTRKADNTARAIKRLTVPSVVRYDMNKVAADKQNKAQSINKLVNTLKQK